MEEEFEDLLPETNKEYRIKKLNPSLGCSFCKPNRGENSDWHHRKSRKKEARKKIFDSNKKAERKFKSKHRKDDVEE